MRSSKSRSRSKGNRNNNNRSVGNVVNRVFDSSGPESKVRGTPQQIIDKYNQLARDAQLSNDRVAAENFQQHAEHYTRMLAEAMREQQEKQDRQQQQNQQNQQNNSNQNNQNPNQNNNQNNPNNQNQPRRADDGGAQDAANVATSAPVDTAPVQPQPVPTKPRATASSDVIDLDQDKESSGLVETPEERPQRPRRSRRKAPSADANVPADPPKSPTPDAAE